MEKNRLNSNGSHTPGICNVREQHDSKTTIHEKLPVVIPEDDEKKFECLHILVEAAVAVRKREDQQKHVNMWFLEKNIHSFLRKI